MAELLSTTTPDRPMLVFKVGVLGCTPLNAMEDLAAGRGMQLYSSERMHKTLIDDRLRRNVSPNLAKQVSLHHIRRLAYRQIEPRLRDGQDVMLDMFHNGRTPRKGITELARRAGAVTIALNICTPAEVIFERLERWIENDSFIVPISEWNISPIAAAQEIQRHLVEPELSEGIDYVFPIDGSTASKQDIIDQFDAAMLGANLRT